MTTFYFSIVLCCSWSYLMMLYFYIDKIFRPLARFFVLHSFGTYFTSICHFSPIFLVYDILYLVFLMSLLFLDYYSILFFSEFYTIKMVSLYIIYLFLIYTIFHLMLYVDFFLLNLLSI